MLDDGTRKMPWDAFGRLREVRRASDDTLVARYDYDADNRRMVRQVLDGGIDADYALNGTTHFYYTGWLVIEERVLDGSAEVLARQFTWGSYLDEIWTVDDRSGGITVADLNDGQGAERHFALANTLFSVHGLTNEEGELVEAYEYDAYGRHTTRRPGAAATEVAFDATDDVALRESSAHGNPFLYTGQRFDAETGLMYYKNRYYNAKLGRFVSRDPLGLLFMFRLEFGASFTYALNRPYAYVDQYGLSPNCPNPATELADCLEHARLHFNRVTNVANTSFNTMLAAVGAQIRSCQLACARTYAGDVTKTLSCQRTCASRWDIVRKAITRSRNIYLEALHLAYNTAREACYIRAAAARNCDDDYSYLDALADELIRLGHIEDQPPRRPPPSSRDPFDNPHFCPSSGP